MPSSILDDLLEAYTQVSIRNRAILEEFTLIAERFRQQGIEFIVLKGADILSRLYGVRGARPSQMSTYWSTNRICPPLTGSFATSASPNRSTVIQHMCPQGVGFPRSNHNPVVPRSARTRFGLEACAEETSRRDDDFLPRNRRSAALSDRLQCHPSRAFVRLVRA